MTLGLKFSGQYFNIPLRHDRHHVYLPFKSEPKSYYSGSFYSGNSSSAPQSYLAGTETKYMPSKAPAEEKFDPSHLRKLHLQLKHGTHSAMREWIRAAGKWSAELDECISSLIDECSCKLAKAPRPHPVASTTLPVSEKQTVVAVDVIFLEGVPCLHVVDKCTGWSETAVLRSRNMSQQVSEFMRIQPHRHGNPEVIYGDREYLNLDFKNMCNDISARFVPLAANDHEANGTVERANRTLRNFFRRIRAENQKSAVADILSEATYGKNICIGSKIASSFELLYGRKPRIMDQPRSPAVTVDDHVKHVPSSVSTECCGRTCGGRNQ